MSEIFVVLHSWHIWEQQSKDLTLHVMPKLLHCSDVSVGRGGKSEHYTLLCLITIVRFLSNIYIFHVSWIASIIACVIHHSS